MIPLPLPLATAQLFSYLRRIPAGASLKRPQWTMENLLLANVRPPFHSATARSPVKVASSSTESNHAILLSRHSTYRPFISISLRPSARRRFIPFVFLAPFLFPRPTFMPPSLSISPPVVRSLHASRAFFH